MRIVFDGIVRSAYSYFTLVSGAEPDEFVYDMAFEGQTNGICGGALPNFLLLVTGLHTGPVHVRVERHDSAPDLSPEWEDAVEATFTASLEPIALCEWADEGEPLDVPAGVYRVRYCARGMDAGKAADHRSVGDGPPADSYLLQLWESDPAPDRILVTGSATAAGWHSQAGGAPADAPAEGQADNAGESRRLARVQEASSLAPDLDLLDRDLLVAVAEASEGTQRAVAAWATLKALEVANMRNLPALAPAVAALEAGEPLPSPFDNFSHIAAITSEVPVTFAAPIPGRVDEDEGPTPIQPCASDALNEYAESDSFLAALSCLTVATVAWGPDYPELFHDAKEVFGLG